MVTIVTDAPRCSRLHLNAKKEENNANFTGNQENETLLNSNMNKYI